MKMSEWTRSRASRAIIDHDVDTLRRCLAERLCTPNDFIDGYDSLLFVCRPIQSPASWEVLTDEF
jgi:hypothetical protein